MIRTFGNKLAKDLVEECFSKEVRMFPNDLIVVARKKLAIIHAARSINDLKVPPGNKLELLKGDRKGYYSIRINIQWRIVFMYINEEAYNVSVEDYHK